MATVATTDQQVPHAVAGMLPTASWKVWAAIAAVSLAWGTTFLAIRVMVRTIPPLIGGGLRWMIACVVMFAIIVIRQRITGAQQVVVRHGWRVHGSMLILGVLLAGSFSAIGIAEQHIASSLAALIYASVPLWVILMRVGFGRERVRRVTLAGTVVGFIGVALVLSATRSGHADFGSLAICVLASASWAAATYAGTRLLLPRDTLITSAWEVLWGGLVSLGLGFAIGEGAKIHPGAISLVSIAGLASLTIVSTGVGFTSFAWLLKHAPVSRTATSSYIVPLVAVLAGALVLGETIGPATLLGAALIVASIGVTIKTDRATTVVDEPTTPEAVIPPHLAVDRVAAVDEQRDAVDVRGQR
jgi:drug/metabolite transporter (DMT)-like permease